MRFNALLMFLQAAQEIQFLVKQLALGRLQSRLDDEQLRLLGYVDFEFEEVSS